MTRDIKVADIVIVRGLTEKGRAIIREHGERWLVREVDGSVLSRRLGHLVCPSSYIGTSNLDPAYDRPSSIHQDDGYARWIKPNDRDFEIVRIAKYTELTDEELALGGWTRAEIEERRAEQGYSFGAIAEGWHLHPNLPTL